MGGMLLVGSGLLISAFTTNLYVLMTAVSLQGIGTGLALPAVNLMITGAADQQERGMVTALYGTVRFFGAAFGPPIFGLFVANSKLQLFIISAIAVILAGILSFTCIKAPRIPSNEGSGQGPKSQAARQEKTQPRINNRTRSPIR